MISKRLTRRVEDVELRLLTAVGEPLGNPLAFSMRLEPSWIIEISR
jgi:hypothetical protein